MKAFICINDLSKVKEHEYDPKKIIDKKVINEEISGIFFYSKSVEDLALKKQSSL